MAWSFPILGALLFVTFGVDRVALHGKRKREQNQNLLHARTTAAEALPLAYWQALKDLQHEPDNAVCDRIDRAVDAFAPDFPLLGKNEILPLITGPEAYPAMLEAIRSAKHHIHFQCFIIRNDYVAKMFFEAMAEKAREGVSVRVLFDRFGSTQAIISGFFWRYHLIPNFEIKGWTQVNLLKRRLQINLRNHRKSLIVDGKTVFFGGINLDKVNLPENEDQAHRDYHFKAQGSIVQQFQYAFLQDWFFMAKDPPEKLLQEHFFPSCHNTGSTPARVILSGPATEEHSIEDLLFMLIGEASKQILIVTPYFVPSAPLIAALRAAASRGVDIHLILPDKNNHFYAGWAARAFFAELLGTGVRIFLRKPPFIHAKAMVVDSHIVTIGTANWDIRSLHLNYETNVLAYDQGLANQIKKCILDEESESEEIHLAGWEARPEWQRLMENACSLLSPIL